MIIHRFAANCAYGFLAGALIGIVSKVISPNAHAEHAYNPHEHLGSLVSPSEPESYCIKVLDDSLDQGTAFVRVLDALLNENDPSRDWEGIRWVDYEPLSQCKGANPGYISDLIARIRFYIINDVENYCDPLHRFELDFAGCRIWGEDTYPEPLSGHYATRNEFRRADIFLEESNIDDGTPNHEVGHAFGLRDGGPDYPPEPNPTSVPTYTPAITPAAWGSCGSVMHSYGCNEPDWPTAADIASVESLVPTTSESGGGGAIGDSKW